MKAHNVLSGLHGLCVNRILLRSLVIRDVESRYRGTLLGFMWAIIYPLMMLSVYVFVFAGVFKARWGGSGDMRDFVLMLYCGLIVHAIVSETLSRSPSAIVSNPNYVKKVIFPLELLPIIHLASALFNAVIGIVLLCVFLLVLHHEIPYTAIYVPLVLLPLSVLTAGLAWQLAALGVFLRDIGQIIGVAMSALMFLSPVFYPASAAPAMAQQFLYLNPLTFPMEELRAVLIIGHQPDWLHWAVYCVVALVVALSGMWLFQKARPAFADVI